MYSVTGDPTLSENERDISLPARMGGLDLCNPKDLAQEENRNSCSATGPLVRAISEQKRGRMHECSAEAANIRKDLKAQNRKHQKEKVDIIRDQTSTT